LAPGRTSLSTYLKSGGQVTYVITVRLPESSGVKFRPNVRLDFYFVQLDKSSLYRVGMGWPGTIGGTAAFQYTRDLSSGATAATASLTAQVLPRLDLAQAAGWARVQKQASLIVANGEEGNFSTLTELNFLIQKNLTTGIETVRFGTNVRVRPRYDEKSGRSEFALSTEVSDATGGADIPGRVISKLDTLVNLELGQAIVLAGLSSKSDRSDRSGLPLLSQIPIIGVFFGIHTGNWAETENLVFIIPTLVDPTPVNKRTLIDQAFNAYSSYAGEEMNLHKLMKVNPDGKKPGKP
jgi:pilus assembly protein CpaC